MLLRHTEPCEFLTPGKAGNGKGSFFTIFYYLTIQDTEELLPEVRMQTDANDHAHENKPRQKNHHSRPGGGVQCRQRSSGGFWREASTSSESKGLQMQHLHPQPGPGLSTGLPTGAHCRDAETSGKHQMKAWACRTGGNVDGL